MGSDEVYRCLNLLFQFESAGVKLIIPPPLRYQLLVIAALDNLAVFEDANHIGVADCGKSVRDDKNGATLHEFVHSLLDKFFSASVDGACSLVENEHGRVGYRRSRNGEELALTLRESAFASFAAALTSSSVASSFPKRMLSATVPVKRCVS